MEQNVNFKFFDEALVQRVIDFTELPETGKTKEAVKALADELKGLYSEKDATLKAQTKEQLVSLKKTHQEKLVQLDKDLERDLAEAAAKDTDPKELHNIKFGLETVCKRAKIKERNSYNEQIKELKMQRVFLHEEYTRLVYNITGVVSPVESLRNKALESYAAFNLKATLTNKQFTEHKVEVTGVDVEPPVLVNSQLVDGEVEIFFSDDISAIDFTTVYAVDPQAQVVYPLRHDPEAVSVTFAYPEDYLNIFVSDTCGNTLQLVLTTQ